MGRGGRGDGVLVRGPRPAVNVKVLHFQRVAGIGGSERHLLELLPGLAEQGHDVRMCVFGEKEFGRFVEPMRRAGIDTVVLPAGPDLNPGLFRSSFREIRRFNPELVHTHLIHADLYAQVAARFAHVPAVSSVHSTHDFYARLPARIPFRIAGRLAGRRIAISDFVASYLTENHLTPPGRLCVVAYGIRASSWDATLSEKEVARSIWGLTAQDAVVGMAARLIHGKGHTFLMDAIAKAIGKHPNLKLLVAGDGPLRSQLESYAERFLPKGAATFSGHIDDIHSFMRACDVLAFPTMPELREGFGLAALEAMAAGLPVVATRVGSLPELVLEGETGLLATPGAVDELAGILTELADDEQFRLRLGAAGRIRAETVYSRDAMIAKTLSVYREAVLEK